MNDKSKPNASDVGAKADTSAIATTGRRGLLKGLGAGTPILLTLSSAPVQAASVCVMPSGYISAATFNSRHQGATVCTSQGPTFFKGNSGNSTYWPTSAPNTQTTQFRDASLFGAPPDGSSGGAENDMMAGVLAGTYTSDFTKFCIAAYLNSRNPPLGWPVGLTPVYAISIWRCFKAGGGLPSGVPTTWTVADAETWLRTLMGP